jgi:hypothetical protein
MSSLKSSSKRGWGVGFRTAMQLLGGLMGALLLCLPLFSQGNLGRITGTVTDQSGGVVAGAAVTVTDTERGVTKTFVTNEPGEYNAPTLVPSTYKVRVEAKGFKTVERQNIELGVGKEIRVDMSLAPGGVAETITITEQLPLVETTNATLGGTLNNADIQDMPLNGRNYQNLLNLRPGVAVQPGGGPWTQSTNNIRPDESGWMLDGVLNVNFYDARPIANMPSPFTDGATILPIDAIQEFNLEENPKAEYGWKPGAVVNVGVRSGTNTLHGAAYGFYRSSNWDARALFNPTDGSCASQAPLFCTKSQGQLKQFGGVMGGPVKKDKLFFFSGYEGLRSFVGQRLATTGTPETVASTKAPNGSSHCSAAVLAANPTADCRISMVDAIMAQQLTAAGVSPVSMALACPNLAAKAAAKTVVTTDVCREGLSLTQGLWPSNISNSINYLDPLPNSNISDNGVAKMDYHINNKHSLNGLLLIGNYTGDGLDHPIINFNERNTFKIRSYTVGANEVWAVNSRLVNEFRFGFNKVTSPFSTDDSGIIPDGSGLTGGKGFAVNTGLTEVGGLPNLYVDTFAVIGSWHNRPTSWANKYSDFQDNVSYLMGKHTLKFGGEFAHIWVDSIAHDNVRGRVDFSHLQDLFAGNPKNGRYFVGNAERQMTWNSSAVFFQDDWRLGPKLTLNLGARYSYVSPMKEANNLFGNFDPTSVATTGGLIQQGQAGVPSLWKPDRKDISPRAGFAWDISGKGTTVVRGGASVIYSTFMAAYFLAQGGLQDTTGTTIAADPTGACRDYVAPGGTCPAGRTFGGSITTASVVVPAANLCWDPQVAPNCQAGVSQPTVFPKGAVTACTPAVGANPKALCNLLAVDPNLTTPYITNWSLGVQHAFNNNLSLEVGYVGTHGSRLTGFVDLNQGDSTGFHKYYANGFNYINQISNDGRSNYHSLQTTLTERTSHGLSFTAGYTFGHGLDNGSLNRQGFLPQDSTKPGAEYASGDFDIRHRFTLTTSYNVPGIKGFAQMLEGWKLNSVWSLQSAQPWMVSESSPNAFNFSGSNDTADRWDFFGNPADYKSGANSIPFCPGSDFGNDSTGKAIVLPNAVCTQTSGVSGFATPLSASAITSATALCTAKAADTTAGGTLQQAGCFVKGNSVMTPPAVGSFGNNGRNVFRDSGFKNVDFSVFKNFTYKERFSAQFRVEFFNIFNHPNIANPFGSVNGSGVGNDPSAPGAFGCGCATADIAGGSPFVSSGTPRAMQLGLKLTF